MTYLVLTDPGSYVGKQKERFKITFGYSSKPASYVPANRVEGILIESKASISSGAFELLRKYGIHVIWKQYKDDDGLMLLPFSSNGTVEIRREQYQSLNDYRGVFIASAIAYQACMNKLTVLRRIRRYHSHLESQVNSYMTKIEEILDEFELDDTVYSSLDYSCRQKLMNYEARVAKVYYSALQEVLLVYNWTFNGRSRRPAKDEFNALLNYNYAVLKGQMAERLAIAGLDIYAGYLHVDRSGRESLLLDLIEEFRQVIDEILIKLVISEKIHIEMFDTGDEGVLLSQHVKEKTIEAFFNKFNSKIRSKKFDAWIIYQARQLSKFIRKQISEYQPFQIKVKDPW